jgi:DNA-binding MurR/RpiR family transcriptional regulator
MKTNLLNVLKQGAQQMTPAQRRVADYILKNPIDASFLTLDQLSGIVGTSTTTVMRLSFKFGYSGYTEFQKDLQELLRDRVAPTTRLEINKKGLEHSSILANCAETQVNNIKSVLNILSEETIDKCLGLLRNASTIYIVGTRSSFAIAYYLHHALNQTLGNCVLMKADSGDNVDTVLNINPSALVIAITLPRYAKATVDLMKVIKGFGPKIIAITDGYNSPLAPLADLVLPCSYRSLAYHNSIVGPIFLADFLITALAVKDPLKAKTRLDAAESILKKMNILIDQ